MKKRLIIITTLIAALGVVPFIYGAPGAGHRGMHGRHGMHAMHGGGPGFGILGHLARMKAELDLSDAQVEQLRQIFAETREQNEPYRDEVRGGLKDVAEVLLADPNNVAGAQVLLDRQAAAERAMKQNILSATSRALNVLTAEQRAKLSGMLAERAQRFQQRRGR